MTARRRERTRTVRRESSSQKPSHRSRDGNRFRSTHARRHCFGIALLLLLGPLGQTAVASPFIFDDRSAFLAATRAQRDTSPYPSAGTHVCFPAGSLVEQICGLQSELTFGDWTSALPTTGSAEPDLSLVGSESFEIVLDASVGVHSIGWELEDSDGGSATSTFTVVLHAGSQEVGRHIFDPTGSGPGWGAPTGLERTFVGLWSETPFDRVEILEVETLQEDEYFGPVYVGLRPPPTWQRKVVSGATNEVLFGLDVSLDGDQALIGEYQAFGPTARDTFFGAAYLYDREPDQHNSWRQTQRLIPSDPHDSAFFGASVAVSGDIALIAASNHNAGPKPNGPGAAYVFAKNGTAPESWTEVAMLFPPSPADGFGIRVNLVDDVAVIGGRCFSCAGDPVHIFHRDLGGPEAWGHVTTLTPPLAEGSSIATDGETIVLGAPIDLANQRGPYPGAVYVYRRDAGGPDAWGLVRTLQPPSPSSGLGFGNLVDVEGDLLIVSTDSPQETANSVYAFERDRGGPEAWGLLTTLQDFSADRELPRRLSFDGETLALTVEPPSLVPQSGRQRYAKRRVRLYRRAGSGFTSTLELVAVDGERGDFFEVPSQSDGVTLIGAPQDNDLGLGSGSVTFFAPFILNDGFEDGHLDRWTPFVEENPP